MNSKQKLNLEQLLEVLKKKYEEQLKENPDNETLKELLNGDFKKNFNIMFAKGLILMKEVGKIAEEIEVKKPKLYEELNTMDLTDEAIGKMLEFKKEDEINPITNLKGYIKLFNDKILEHEQEIKLLNQEIDNSLFPDFERQENADKIESLKQKISYIKKYKIPEYEKALKLLNQSIKPYHIQPNSGTSHTVLRAINNALKGEIKGENIKTTQKGKNLEIESLNSKIIIKNMDSIFKGKDIYTAKVFNFILRKNNDQVNKNADIKFNLSELVTAGIYKTNKSARTGFINCYDKLMSVIVHGTQKNGKYTINEGGVLFSKYSIDENDNCIITKMDINLKLLCKYFSLIPVWADSLNKHAYSLCYYIFYMANNKKSDIVKKGSFDLKIKSISDFLGLPAPEETDHHKQLIMIPILEAIKEIETARDESDYKEFKIIKQFDESKRPAESFLKGSLKIEISAGEALEYLTKKALKKG